LGFSKLHSAFPEEAFDERNFFWNKNPIFQCFFDFEPKNTSLLAILSAGLSKLQFTCPWGYFSENFFLEKTYTLVIMFGH